MNFRLAALLISIPALALAIACASTGDPERDAARDQLVAGLCSAQCSVALTLAVDFCDGDLDGQVTPPEDSSLYAVCILEANTAAELCPLACSQIRITEPSDEIAPSEPNASPVE